MEYTNLKSKLNEVVQTEHNNLENFNTISLRDDLNSFGTNIDKIDFNFCEELDDIDANDSRYIKIIDIRKNESYGSVFLFLQKPSPLSLRVQSKTADLFLLLKYYLFNICKKYPNIWKIIYRKSFYNMLSIKKLTFHKLNNFCKANELSGIVNTNILLAMKNTNDNGSNDINNDENNYKRNIKEYSSSDNEQTDKRENASTNSTFILKEIPKETKKESNKK